MNHDEIIEELEKSLEQVNTLIENVKTYAAENTPPIDPYKMQDTTGRFSLQPLLVSKAEILIALLPLQKEKEAKEVIAKMLEESKAAFLEGWNKGQPTILGD